jgi:hypothetical protein
VDVEVQEHGTCLCLVSEECPLAASQHGHHRVRDSKHPSSGYSSSSYKATNASMGAPPLGPHAIPNCFPKAPHPNTIYINWWTKFLTREFGGYTFSLWQLSKTLTDSMPNKTHKPTPFWERRTAQPSTKNPAPIGLHFRRGTQCAPWQKNVDIVKRGG